MIKKAYRFLNRWFDAARKGSFRGRRQPETEYQLAVVDLPVPQPLFLSELDTTLFPIGLGVYQGEAIILRSFGDAPPNQCTVIEKLQYLHLPHIRKDKVRDLLCLVRLLTDEKLFYPETTDSQKTETVKLDACRLTCQCTFPPGQPCKAASDSASIPAQTKLPREQNPICQLCQKLAAKYSYGNSSTT